LLSHSVELFLIKFHTKLQRDVRECLLRVATIISERVSTKHSLLITDGHHSFSFSFRCQVLNNSKRRAWLNQSDLEELRAKIKANNISMS